MICSISTSKSGPTWLDRLRSTKGFPTGDNLDLDHFLRNNDDNPKPNSSESTQSDTKRVLEISSDNGVEEKEEWLGVMSNVLSDLFNMGGESNGKFRFSGKKSSRKQTNPKFCLVSRDEQSSGSVRKDENAHEENVNNNSNLDKNSNLDAGDVEIEEDVERGERELLGYSRNEVTVIDTSCVEWKFEKLVYRKRNVWKVREKKGKSRAIGRKKRKGNGSDDGNADGKKKLKVSNGGDDSFPSKHGDNLQDEKEEEVSKEASGSDGLSQVPKNRLRLSRLSKKSKKGGSPVVLIKGMPTRKKTGAKGMKNRTPNFGTKKHQVVCNKAQSSTFPMGKGYRD